MNFTLSSHIACAFSPHYQIWFMKSGSTVKCVDARGEIYISSFSPSKMFFYFVSVSHSGTSLTRDLKEDDSSKAENADQKKKKKEDWIFMNTSWNCRCSFKNRSTLIIARLFKVFTFYFWTKNNKWSQKSKWGEEMSRLVKRETLFCTIGVQGNFIYLKSSGSFVFQPSRCTLSRYPALPPISFASNTAKGAITLVYNSWPLLWNSGCRQNGFFGGGG